MSAAEPKFTPKPGQIDFTHIRYCPTLNCVVRKGGEILLVKRPSGFRFYPAVWGGITGFLDDAKTLEEKVREELSEELGFGPEAIVSLRVGETFEIEAPQYGKVWIVHPVLVETAASEISLNWEGEEAAWVAPDDLSKYDCMPGFIEMVQRLLAQ